MGISSPAKIAADSISTPGETTSAAIDLPDLPIDVLAVFAAVENQYKHEWESKKCICGKGKWAHYPFCRSCSIRLLRAHLYRGALRPCREHEAGRFPESWRGYDIARDFLINGKLIRRKSEDEEAA
jgi:hypothetical protein